MKKELLLTLIKKDINELSALTGGFEQMTDIPQVLLDLSIEKARQLAANLSELGSESALVQEQGKPVNVVTPHEVPMAGTPDAANKVEQVEKEPAINTPQNAVPAEGMCADTKECEEEGEKELKEIEQLEEQPTLDEEIYEETGVNVNGWMEESEDEVSDSQPEKESVQESEDCSEPVAQEPVSEVKPQPVADATPAECPCEVEAKEEADAMADAMMQEDTQESAPIELEPSDYVLTSDAVELKEAATLAQQINGIQANVDTEPEQEDSQRPTAKPEANVTCLADTINKSESLGQSLTNDEDKSLNGTLKSKPITDLKTAITIADRFRFQRELFGGDGEKMSKAIDDLNKLQNLEQAEAYLKKHFNWSEENSAVVDFKNLLHRRY